MLKMFTQLFLDSQQQGGFILVYCCLKLETDATELMYRCNLTWTLMFLLFSRADCSIIDSKGNTFNFEPLTMTDDNYEVDESPVSLVKFVINVCTTLVHRKGNVD